LKILAILLGLIVLGLLIYSCAPKKKKEESITAIPVVDFTKPIGQWDLPPDLSEVSGLATLDSTTLLTHNDENGKIYAFDTTNGAVSTLIDLNQKGDFEACEYYNQIIYLMESKGTIHTIDINTKDHKVIKLKHKDVDEFEGMVFNPDKNELLLLAKKTSGKSNLFKVNLETETLEKLDEKVADPKKFKGSGLAYSKGFYYAISAATHQLIVLNAQHLETVATYNIPKDILTQPEGVTVSSNGKVMYISTEGSIFSKAKLYSFPADLKTISEK
jgi:DNA-binding beta-propeller fold protein YncE